MSSKYYKFKNKNTIKMNDEINENKLFTKRFQNDNYLGNIDESLNTIITKPTDVNKTNKFPTNIPSLIPSKNFNNPNIIIPNIQISQKTPNTNNTPNKTPDHAYIKEKEDYEDLLSRFSKNLNATECSNNSDDNCSLSDKSTESDNSSEDFYYKKSKLENLEKKESKLKWLLLKKKRISNTFTNNKEDNPNTDSLVKTELQFVSIIKNILKVDNCPNNHQEDYFYNHIHSPSDIPEKSINKIINNTNFQEKEKKPPLFKETFKEIKEKEVLNLNQTINNSNSFNSSDFKNFMKDKDYENTELIQNEDTGLSTLTLTSDINKSLVTTNEVTTTYKNLDKILLNTHIINQNKNYNKYALCNNSNHKSAKPEIHKIDQFKMSEINHLKLNEAKYNSNNKNSNDKINFNYIYLKENGTINNVENKENYNPITINNNNNKNNNKDDNMIAESSKI